MPFGPFTNWFGFLLMLLADIFVSSIRHTLTLPDMRYACALFCPQKYMRITILYKINISFMFFYIEHEDVTHNHKSF